MSPAAGGLVVRVVAAYADLRASMRRELAAGRDEPLLLAYVMAGCAVLFLCALPRIVIVPPAEVLAEGPDARFGFFLANLVTFFFFAPLFLYGVAAVAGLLARACGGAGGWRETRLATFWAMLVAAPALLAASLLGLGLTLSGAAAAASAVAYAASLVSAWIWAAFLAEAHGFRRTLWVFSAEIALAALLVGLIWAALVGAMAAT